MPPCPHCHSTALPDLKLPTVPIPAYNLYYYLKHQESWMIQVKADVFNHHVKHTYFITFKIRYILGGSVAKSWPTLVTPWTVAPPCYSVHGIFQARILEWIALSFSRGSFQSRDWNRVSCIVGRFFTDWAMTAL